MSQFADGVFQAVLITLIVFLDVDAQDTAAGIAKATLILVVPFSIVGPFTGVFIDRWSRRGILAFTPFIRAAAALALVAFDEGWTLYALALVPVSLNRFYLATAAASVPSLVDRRDLLVSNSMASVGGTVVTFAGFGAGTQLVERFGVDALLLAVVGGWILAGILGSRIRAALRAEGVRHTLADVRGDFRDLAEGLRRLSRAPAALGSIVSTSLDQLLVGVVTTLSLVVFREEFQAGVASYGRIIAAGGAGILLGTLTVGILEPRFPKTRIVAGAFAVAGVTCLAVAPAITGPTIFLVSFVLGLTFAYRKVPADTIVQEEIPDAFRGRVFAVYDLLYAMARPMGVLLSVPLIPNLSSGALLALVGAVYLLWTPVLPLWARGRSGAARDT